MTDELAKRAAETLVSMFGPVPEGKTHDPAVIQILVAFAEAVAREAREAALEEAAKECERIYDNGLGGAHQGEQCIRTAAAIRALKGGSHD